MDDKDDKSALNTDKTLYTDPKTGNSIILTERGGLGIKVNGLCIVMRIEKWHRLGNEHFSYMPNVYPISPKEEADVNMTKEQYEYMKLATPILNIRVSNDQTVPKEIVECLKNQWLEYTDYVIDYEQANYGITSRGLTAIDKYIRGNFKPYEPKYKVFWPNNTLVACEKHKDILMQLSRAMMFNLAYEECYTEEPCRNCVNEAKNKKWGEE